MKILWTFAGPSSSGGVAHESRGVCHRHVREWYGNKFVRKDTVPRLSRTEGESRWGNDLSWFKIPKPEAGREQGGATFTLKSSAANADTSTSGLAPLSCSTGGWSLPGEESIDLASSSGSFGGGAGTMAG